MVVIQANSTSPQGYYVRLEFKITQHIRDEKLFISFIAFFNCGRISKRGEAIDFLVTKLKDLEEKIIPFFKKHPIRGVKALDFADFCDVAEMIKLKKHLTEEGLERIRKKKAGMNRGRKLH